jgi:hypothetical protein
MNVVIKLMLMCNGIRVARGGTFPLRKRKPEEVAFEWIQVIKKEMNVEAILKVEANGVDITERLTKYL